MHKKRADATDHTAYTNNEREKEKIRISQRVRTTPDNKLYEM